MGDWRKRLEAELVDASGFEPRCLNPGDRINPPEYEDIPEGLELDLIQAEGIIDNIAGSIGALKALASCCPWNDDDGTMWEIIVEAAQEVEQRRAQGKEPPLLDRQSMVAFGLSQTAAEA